MNSKTMRWVLGGLGLVGLGYLAYRMGEERGREAAGTREGENIEVDVYPAQPPRSNVVQFPGAY